MARRPGALDVSAGRLAIVSRPVSPEELFSALDGQHLTVGQRRWRVTVFAIHDEAGERWIQLGISSQRKSCLVTLRENSRTTADEIARVLTEWLALRKQSAAVPLTPAPWHPDPAA